ncbi:MAG TPA: hypothetical protein PLR07_08120 [Promineifilum sp.]|nr:hypothetical protein [Promineifilum sp.]
MTSLDNGVGEGMTMGVGGRNGSTLPGAARVGVGRSRGSLL